MRTLLVAIAPAFLLGCHGASEEREAVRSSDAPPVSMSITLDRATIAATDELTGTLRVEFRAPLRSPGESAKAWSFSKSWRLELGNESAPLLALVVDEDSDLARPSCIVSEDRVVVRRFRIVACPALAERSIASTVPLQRFGAGNHALRIVLDARNRGWDNMGASGPNGMPVEPLVGSFASRWTTFDVVAAGRPLDADDVEAIAFADERLAGVVFDSFGSSVLGPERMAAMVARATGALRGQLAESFVRTFHGGGWRHLEAWWSFQSAFADVGDAGLDCSMHDAPPFLVRIPLGRAIPIRNASSESHNFSVLWVESGFVVQNHAITPGHSLDAAKIFVTRGLYRAKCDVHPQIWGWILVE